MSAPAYLVVGQILRPHGVRGEVRVQVLTAHPEHLATLQTLYLADDPAAASPQPITLDTLRFHQQYALVKFKGYPDRTAVERLRDLYVLVALQDAVPLAENEAYLYEIIGLSVQTEDGELLGEIVDVLETGANDVYVLKHPAKGEILIPATEHTIRHTDFASQRMTVRLPEGLLDPAVPDETDEA